MRIRLSPPPPSPLNPPKNRLPSFFSSPFIMVLKPTLLHLAPPHPPPLLNVLLTHLTVGG